MFSELKQIIDCSRRIWSLLQISQQWRLVFAVLLMAAAGALINVPALVLGRLVDDVVDSSQVVFAEAWPFLGIILASILIREAVQVLRRYLVEDTCTRVEKQARVDLVHHLLRLNLEFYSGWKTGALHGRVNRSLEGLIKLLKLGFLDLFPALFVAFFALAVALYRVPLLGVVMALVIPLGLFIVLVQVSTQKGIRVNLLRGKEEMDGTIVELLGGLENVRAMNAESFETSRVDDVSERLRKIEIRHHIWMAGFDAAKYLNEGLFHILVLSLSIWMATSGMISTGDILTYSMLFIGVVTPLREVHRILDEAHESSIRVNDFMALTKTPEDTSFAAPSKKPKEIEWMPSDYAIQARRLSFAYPNAEVSALSQIDLSIRRGEVIGICGPAGCGKSTLLRLLLRLMEPSDGDLCLFGQPIESLGRGDIADLIGYVSQKPFLVSGTVSENIAYGSGEVEPHQIEEAARQANIHDEILGLADGYQTQVGEGGGKLSGGQRQRIALARAFLRKPAVLILDEATSALDNINEKAVQNAIERSMRGKTVIAVAHRLTTLRNTDRIFVFQSGRVVETGTYYDLQSADGLFSRLSQSAEAVFCAR